MRKTVAAATMAASLTIGGAAGAVLFSPSVSGAQTDDTTTAEVDRPDCEHRGARHAGPGFRGGIAESLSDVLGLSTEEIRTELAAGSSLAQIAESQGVEVQAVIDAIVTERQERLDAAVEGGRITEEQAAERAEALAGRVADMVERSRPLDGEGPHGEGHGPGVRAMNRHGGLRAGPTGS